MVLSDSYDRLSTIHQNYRIEVKETVEKCKIEVEEAREKLRTTIAENEKLRETNDIQNRLWKLWINEFDNKEKDAEKEVIEVKDSERREKPKKKDDDVRKYKNKDR